LESCLLAALSLLHLDIENMVAKKQRLFNPGLPALKIKLYILRRNNTIFIFLVVA
jgi:hypothetical protein